MSQLTARDIMNPNVFSVTEDMSVEELGAFFNR